jgi:hypothetical protein
LVINKVSIKVQGGSAVVQRNESKNKSTTIYLISKKIISVQGG